ncbi:MAG: MBOAT family protein [Bacteroidetes bacterium]|nr:MBOAT family protein [Bacteroidota bacterium]
MLFNSLEFLVFFPIVFLLYWHVFKNNLRIQNVLLLLASYVFYGWWDWRFLGLIILSSITDYILGQEIFKSQTIQRKRLFLILSLLINLGILGFFKYFNFFADSLVYSFNQLGIHINAVTLKIILPVGISFYTFQTLSYTIDIYRKRLEPTKDAIAFFTFVAFFPQLVAGPIERASNLIPQFLKKREIGYEQAVSGLRLILYGFFKKVVIADNLATYVEMVYNDPASFNGFQAALATVFFAFQIYCDFSGYSDIAIGTARLFGINLMLNFRTPYFSASIKEFWTRWHISLSTWFRDYVYIGLGGNKVTQKRWAFNIFITFVISGLWHGANITFIIWGAIHGSFYMIEKFLKTLIPKVTIPKIIRIIITFVIVNMAWVFFRASSLSQAREIISSIFTRFEIQSISSSFQALFSSGKDMFYIFPSLVLFFIIELLLGSKSIDHLLNPLKRGFRWLIYILILTWILVFGAFEINQEFIYFQF